jgi:ankyrin repeat protein
VCDALVKLGSRINLRDKQGATPTFVAASRGHSSVVECLIQLGASRHRTNQTGQTPLHVAAHKGHLRTVECLVQLGADVHRTDDQGNTPVRRAVCACLFISERVFDSFPFRCSRRNKMSK